MYYGCAWYPEHWPLERWQTDLRLMREAGMNVVRLAEFAWSRMEPAEGVFKLDWVEQAIDAANRHGLVSVLGTPTASPPAWLTQRYPTVLRVNANGTRAGHGGRGHFNPANAVYLGHCRRIASAMAERFGRDERVIGWQIDNEYWPFSFDADTQRQFQEFLHERYGTLDALNAAWATAYWSQEYSDWSQIPLSIDWQNPCLVTAFRRFFTHIYQRYQKNQVEAIKAHARPGQFLTHNFHGSFEHGDPFVLCEDLDFASYDPYVGTGHLDPYAQGFKLDLVRGFKRKNFWVMETQIGHVNWAGVNNPLDRGETRQLVWHHVAHGADAVLYWQWRSAIGGQEQYHGCLIGQSGEPRPVYAEARQVGAELAAAAPWLAGTRPPAEVALLWSFDDRWALREQKHHKDFTPEAHATAWHRALRTAGVDVDVISPAADLAGYKLVVAPHLYMVDAALAERLVAFAQAGGHLVLGARSGMKDMHDALLEHAQPGPCLAAALGGHVVEYYALEAPVDVRGQLPSAGDSAADALGGGSLAASAKIFAEWLSADAPDCHALLRYAGHSWLDGQPAVLTRVVGSGRMTYCGAWLDDAGFAQLGRWLTAGLPAVTVSEGVEACRRVGPRGEVLILINHTTSRQICRIGRTMRDVLRDVEVGPEVVLEARGVAVLSAPLV